MRPGRTILLFLLLVLSFNGFAQDLTTSGDSLIDKAHKTSLKGYLSDLFSPQYNNIDNRWKATNYLHQRLNFGWIPSSKLSFSAQLRTRLIFNQPGNDTSFVNIHDGVVWRNNKSYFNSTLDRLNLKYIKDKLEITIGRQRINWGQSFVWNPNDLFNSYSFFDFDYIERPGSDAIRLQYYNTFTSSTELAAKIDRFSKLTVAGLYRFNRSGIDFQLLGGLLSSEVMVVGAGWTGSIKSVSVFGEGTYFKPWKNFANTSGMAMIDVGCSKIFANNLGLQLEGLYVSRKPDMNSLFTLLQSTLDVRRIAFAQVNLFGSISYPITPLIKGSLALMWFPGTGGVTGVYTGPSLDISMGNNLNLSVIAQYFKGDFSDATQMQNQLQESIQKQLTNQTLMLAFVRLKWNF